MAAKKRGGLGRGLGGGVNALIPPSKQMESKQEQKSQSTSVHENVGSSVDEEKISADTEQEKKEEKITAGETMVKITKVEPNREQPRKNFNEDALLELAESMKQYGVLQPLLVADRKDYYEIIAGERRWRAAQLAGLKEIPVIIKNYSEQEIVEISLIENIQREDLNPIEEAWAYKRLMEEFHMKQDEIAERVSKSRVAVTNSIRLLKLSDGVQQMLIDDMITSGHARAILAISDADMQMSVATKVFDEKLSVRETEKLVKSVLEPTAPKKTETNTAEDAIYQNLEEKMKAIVGTKVSINRKKNNKGKIEIEYYSQEELERIIDLFESIH